MTKRTMDYVAVACRCLIATVFGIAALSKLRGRDTFTEFVRSTEELLHAAIPTSGAGLRAIRWIAATVVGAELATVVLVLAPAKTRIGFGLTVVVLAAFSFGIAGAVRRGVRASCRCFGASTAPLGKRHLIRNAFLLLVAGVGLVVGSGDLGRAHPAGLLTAVGAAVLLAVVLTRLDDLVDLSTPLSAGSGWSAGDR